MKALKEAIELLKFFKDRKNTKITTMIKVQSCIAELEALQQPKNCDGCIRLPFILIELAKRDGGKCGTCKRFVKDHYELEPKEQ